MLDINFIRENPDIVRRAIQHKGTEDVSVVTSILDADEVHRQNVTELQEVRTRANEIARTIGEFMRAGDTASAEKAKADSSALKGRTRELEEEARESEAILSTLLLVVPNVPHSSVPVGATPDDNVVDYESGEPRRFAFAPVPHWDLLERHQLVDFDRGSKVAGAGFPFYIGAGARLQRALINFFLDVAIQDGGYTELQSPLVVNAASATGTGQLPDKEDLMYEVVRDELFLIPTAEVPVTNLFRDEILTESDLPVKYCCHTPCFRREAGSYGKNVRGLNRLHQFDKIELVQFVRPEDSYEALESLREDAESLLKMLELPYRRLLMCTGDMGFTQAKKYDLEVWSGGQQQWLEVSSISNFEAFQARRMNIRYRSSDGSKPEIIHTLNGSGLALPRVVAALLENYQQADGSIAIPDVLRPYTGFEQIQSQDALPDAES